MQIKQLLYILIIFLSAHIQPNATQYNKHFTLIIDPSGDAKHTGRRIDDIFERGITLQCAEKIKTYIENDNNNITIFITRLPGDIVYELQNAVFANRLNANLFISLNFYSTQDARPTVDLYTFSYGDTFLYHSDNLAFHTYDTAHIKQKNKTNAIVRELAQQLNNNRYQTLFAVNGPYALPAKQIIGIMCPSIVIDAGLKEKTGWSYYVEPLAHEINAIIKTMS